MIKVIVDATPITAKPSGVGLYVANLIQYLSLLQNLESLKLGIFYQPSLNNWLKRDFSYPNLLRDFNDSSQKQHSNAFFFLIQ